jgi:hypothetical protein
MAVITLPRCPRTAQLHSNSGLQRKRRRLMKPVERLPVYEIAQLQELGVFQRDLSQAFDGEASDILRIVGGLAVQAPTRAVQPLEAEDEFERARR